MPDGEDIAWRREGVVSQSTWMCVHGAVKERSRRHNEAVGAYRWLTRGEAWDIIVVVLMLLLLCPVSSALQSCAGRIVSGVSLEESGDCWKCAGTCGGRYMCRYVLSAGRCDCGQTHRQRQKLVSSKRHLSQQDMTHYTSNLSNLLDANLLSIQTHQRPTTTVNAKKEARYSATPSEMSYGETRVDPPTLDDLQYQSISLWKTTSSDSCVRTCCRPFSTTLYTRLSKP